MRSSGLEGWEEGSRPVERETTPPFWRVLAEHLPVVRPRHPCGGFSRLVGEAVGSYLGEQGKGEPVC